jgi:hypothetical protein
MEISLWGIATSNRKPIISRRYSGNFTKGCHIKKLRDPFFIHAGAAHEDLLLFASFVLFLQA